MALSIAFILIDILAVTHVINGSKNGLPNGINPFWKLAFVFKCLTDTIVLDDFKTALDRLKEHKMSALGGMLSDGNPPSFVDSQQARQKKYGPNHSVEMRSGQHFETTPRDWTKDDSYDDIDFETALRMDSTQLGDSGKG